MWKWADSAFGSVFSLCPVTQHDQQIQLAGHVSMDENNTRFVRYVINTDVD